MFSDTVFHWFEENIYDCKYDFSQWFSISQLKYFEYVKYFLFLSIHTIWSALSNNYQILTWHDCVVVFNATNLLKFENFEIGLKLLLRLFNCWSNLYTMTQKLISCQAGNTWRSSLTRTKLKNTQWTWSYKTHAKLILYICIYNIT